MKATNFDVRISRDVAEYLLKYDLLPPDADIMCKEYGEDDDWQGLTCEDLDENYKLWEKWQTFELSTLREPVDPERLT